MSTIPSTKHMSYAAAITYRNKHKNNQIRVVTDINKSQSRLSMNDDINPNWCFSTAFGTGTYGTCFQLYCLHCVKCGNYIERGNYINHSFNLNDKCRLLKYIYCDDLNHHNISRGISLNIYVDKMIVLHNEYDNRPHHTFWNTPNNRHRFLYLALLAKLFHKNSRLCDMRKLISDYLGLIEW